MRISKYKFDFSKVLHRGEGSSFGLGLGQNPLFFRDQAKSHLASQLVRKRNPLGPDDGRLKKNRDAKQAGPGTSVQKLIQPLEWQRGLLSVPDEYDVILTGGRGGGKSTGMCLLILRDVLRFGSSFKGALVRRELAGLRKLEQEIQQMMSAIPELRGSRYLTGQKEFRFSNGAVLYAHYLRDLASFSRFQGIDLSHLFVDESGQLDSPEALLRMRSSMRTTDPRIKPRMVCTANPNGAGAFWHLEHVVHKLTPWNPGWCELFQKEVVLIHSTLFDNSHLSDREGYIAQLKSSCNFDEARIQSEIYGSWDSVSGAFFASVFDERRIMVPAVDRLDTMRDYKPSQLWLSMDWGTRRPSCVLLAWRSSGKVNLPDGRIAGAGSVFVVDAIHTNRRHADGSEAWNEGIRELTTSAMATQILEMLERYGIDIATIPRLHRVADAAIGAQLGSNDGSIGAQLRKQGVGFVAAPKGKRAPGWALLKTYLEASGSPDAPGLYVTPRVKAFWATIPTLQASSNDPEDLDTNSCDHLADSLRYLIVSMNSPKYRGQNDTRTSVRVW